MLIKQNRPSDVKSSEITPKSVFMNRRRFIQSAAMAGLIPGLIPQEAAAARGNKLPGIIKSPYSTDQEQTPYGHVTKYNNFYEFGTGKDDPVVMAQDFEPKPWKVTVEGEVGKPGVYDFDDLIKPHQLEERIYRFRCVEAWSMVVPWVGIPLGDIIKRLEPTSKAKYIAFETLFDPARMPGQTRRVLQWPYVEGLRMDEAMNPLTLMTVGLYGEELPNQNGAPIRLVLPWKYGFKSIKSIVTMRFVESMPPTSWNRSAAHEYGFYANVNPEVSHPRWSQAKERPLGGGYFASKVPTLKFNGYGEEVAGLYAGMDLAKFY
jgi:methionine sulfoxide reductase catalytic subunit